MKHPYTFLLAGILSLSLLTGCGSKEEAPAESGATNPPAAANNMDYLGVMAKAKTTAEKVVDISSVQEAISLFQAGEDRLPENLDEVVSSGYLPRLPELPQGYQYAYFPKSGRVKAMKVQLPGVTPTAQ